MRWEGREGEKCESARVGEWEKCASARVAGRLRSARVRECASSNADDL